MRRDLILPALQILDTTHDTYSDYERLMRLMVENGEFVAAALFSVAHEISNCSLSLDCINTNLPVGS